MKNFKITNLKSKVVYLMNEKEKVQFFTMNSLGNYKWEYSKNENRSKFFYNTLFTLSSFVVFYILLFAMCYTFSFIDTLIF